MGESQIEAPAARVDRRVLAVVLVGWAPLLALCAAAGTLAGGVGMSFLGDLDAHIRLLLVLPLLIAAELPVRRYAPMVARQFISREIIAAPDQARFEALVEATERKSSSRLATALMFATACVPGFFLWRDDIATHVDSWRSTIDAAGSLRLTLAGWWYGVVSLTLFRFVFFRWYWHLALWYAFLWRVSRLPLRLNPLHPDRAGGLGFLGLNLPAVAPILLAHSATLAGAIAGHILNEGSTLPAFYLEIAVALVILVGVAILPLVFYFLPLLKAGVEGTLEYGQLSTRYVEGFRAKWMQGRDPRGESLVGTSDIQSLADLGNAHDVLRQLNLIPVSLNAIAKLAVIVALPFAPLVLTTIPLEQLIGRLVDRLF